MSPVALDPCNPPRGVMLQWRDTSATSGWNHRAYWGDKPWDCGGDGPACRRMGNLPPLGQWVRLEVAARSVGFNGNQLYGVGFDVLDGRAWFDRTGTEVCSMPVAAAPEIPADETVWFDDALPAGACPWGTWQWDTAQKASGTQSHTQPSALGREDRYFQCATPMSVATGDKLVSWVLTNPCDPPRELMLAFNDNTGKWTYVYWGENMFGAPGQVRIGDLPPGGRWVRLEVPVATVGLGGRSIVGMEFLAYDGKVWWDRSGKVVGATASSSPDSVEETAEHAPHATTVAAEEKSAKAAMHHRPMSQLWERIKGRFRQGSKPEPEYPPVGLALTARYASQGTATNDLRRYSLYSPELQLLAETNATPLQPWVAQEYIWFNGEPLAQVTVSSGEVAYYFNDHLGAPILQTDASGAVVWRVERDPYGERYATRVGAERHQPLGLPGQEYDASSDRQYNIFRWYRAGWGRYTQVDPILPASTPYSYAGNNPLFYIDPVGLVTQRSPETIYHGVDRSTMWRNCMKKNALPIFPYGCTNLTFGASCVCTGSSSCWTLAVTIWFTQNVWYAPGTSKNTGQAIPADLVRAEETKHVMENLHRYDAFAEHAKAAESIRYRSERACKRACRKLRGDMYDTFEESEPYTHRTNPHPY